MSDSSKSFQRWMLSDPCSMKVTSFRSSSMQVCLNHKFLFYVKQISDIILRSHNSFLSCGESSYVYVSMCSDVCFFFFWNCVGKSIYFSWYAMTRFSCEMSSETNCTTWDTWAKDIWMCIKMLVLNMCHSIRLTLKSNIVNTSWNTKHVFSVSQHTCT